MGVKQEVIARLEMADKWSHKVKTKWHAPEGFFDKSEADIASGLKRAHSDLKGAMSSLNFEINRAGAGMSAEKKSKLEGVKEKLRALYK